MCKRAALQGPVGLQAFAVGDVNACLAWLRERLAAGVTAWSRSGSGILVVSEKVYFRPVGREMEEMQWLDLSIICSMGRKN